MEKQSLYLDREIPIVNPKQAAFYWSRGIKPKRIYPSTDDRDGTPIIVFVFNRDETYILYKEWLDRR